MSCLIPFLFCLIIFSHCSSINISPDEMGDAKMENSSLSIPFYKIYIINLKRRTDKKRAMQKRLDDLKLKIPYLKYEFIEAVDGHVIDKEWLKQNDAAPLISWRDPKIRRPLTRGEIGCMLSHIYAFDKIIESGKPGLIIEDDAIFSDNFVEKLNEMKTELKESKWEMFYLYRQILRGGEKQFGKHLLIPKYSYLTLSYALTVEGIL